MKITTRSALRLVAALQSFDLLTEAPGGEKTPFKIEGQVRLKMARNISRLQEIVQAYQKTRNGFIYTLAEPGQTQVKPENLGEFERQDDALLSVVNDVELLRIAESELQLEVNAVPVSTLAALMPLLEMPAIAIAA